MCVGGEAGGSVVTNENPSRHKGDMKQTRISRLNPMTFNCDLDLGSAWRSHGFCILSHYQS